MTISYLAAGSGSTSATSINLGWPAGLAAGDYVVAVVGSGNAAGSTTVTVPGSHTQLAAAQNTDGTFGNNTGPRRATAAGYEAVGGESGTVTFSHASADANRVIGGIQYGFEKTNDAWDVVGYGGDDSDAGSSISVLFSDVDIAAGDMLLLMWAGNDDTQAISGHGFTATGITFGTITEMTDVGQTVGNDVRLMACRVPVSTGSGTVDVTFTSTSTGSGGATLVRLREVSGGGTQFDVDVSGAMSSAGALARQDNKALAAAAASAGGLTREARKPLAGATTSAGALTRQAGKALTGAMASSGTLATIKAVLRTFTGTIDTSSTLARSISKPLAGSTASTGLLTRRPGKALAGTVASSGALATARVVLLAVAGAMASSGNLVRRAGKALTGSVTSDGQLTRQPRKTLTGTVTSTGAVAVTRVVVLALAGAMTSTGTLTRRVAITATGTLSSSGSLGRQARKVLAAVMAAAGALSVSGGSTPSGWGWLLRRSGSSHPSEPLIDGVHPTTTDVT